MVNHMVNDSSLTVVNMARGSLGKWVTELSEKDITLMYRLAQEEHYSTFRHDYVTFFILCPLFVKNHLIKHQVGGSHAWPDTGWNEISGRYVVMEHFWIPDVFHKQAKISKSGGTDEVLPDSDVLIGQYLAATQTAFNTYHALLEAGVAREEARTLLPLNTYISMFITGSLQFWYHMVRLRTAPDAQRQTRAYAEAINNICENHFGEAWDAITEPK